MTLPARKLRCAVYTRKSSEEGLNVEFSSTDAQREGGHAYIASQKSEGWVSVRDNYDDGGYSGGTLDRPALQRLISDVQAGLIDIVVVYKIDRLSRSMIDFLKLVEIFDQHGVTFVAVTQNFSTVTPMGRLMLNVLLSFARFEREQTGERIRDKIAASRRKGRWTGGPVPYGYHLENHKLVIHEEEAAVIREVYNRFIARRSATIVARELREEGVTSRTGKPFDKGVMYKFLSNRVYIGEAVHKGEAYPGEHKAIITREVWEAAHAILQESPRERASKTRTQMPALLKGLIFAPDGQAMTPTHTRRHGKLYRYYVTMSVLKSGPDTCPVGRIPAGDIEAIVLDQLRMMFRSPDIIVQTWLAAREQDPTLTEAAVRKALLQFDDLWEQLFPAEQARIVQLVVKRVTVSPDGAELQFHTEGLETVLRELAGATPAVQALPA